MACEGWAGDWLVQSRNRYQFFRGRQTKHSFFIFFDHEECSFPGSESGPFFSLLNKMGLAPRMRCVCAALLITQALGWVQNPASVLPLRRCAAVSRQNLAPMQMQMQGQPDRRAAGGLLLAGALFGLSGATNAANGNGKSSNELQREVAALEKEVLAAPPLSSSMLWKYFWHYT